VSKDKCGVYQILCIVSGKSYVGSSRQMYTRWSQHRTKLRSLKHASPRLQQAWNKHGEAKFVFSILEECEQDKLLGREQFYIDAKKRDYNSMPKVRVITAEMRRKMIAGTRAFRAKTTHCPKGHKYSPENTFINYRGSRVCRQCGNDKTNAKYHALSPEAKAERLRRDNERYYANYAEKRAKQNEYARRNREAKKAYDADPVHKARKKELRLMRIAQAEVAIHG
jgi:group I intron endonuclease